MTNNTTFKAELFGHPAGLFFLFFTEMWERFSYYGMRALLVLFLVSDIAAGGWGWPRPEALSLYGLYTGLVYITPIFGGLIADKLLGFRKTIILGAFLMTCGHASMALETEFFFYAGLLLLILGNGAFKPNISSIVGNLYPKNSDRKDGAYTIFYMGINAGAFLGILLCGYIGEKVGWSYGFGLAGIFMFLGMMQFIFVQKIFGKIGLSPKALAEVEANERLPHEHQEETDEKEEEVPPHVERDRLIVIGILAFFTIFFWMAFEQAGGSMTIFAKDYTQRILQGSSATAFLTINTILTLVPLAVVTYVLFVLFSKTFKKYSLSNLFLGISFLIIWFVAVWMIRNEFNMKAYEISFKDSENTEQIATLREVDQFEDGQTVNFIDLEGKGGQGKLKYIPTEEADKYESRVEATIIKQKTDETEVPASWFGILNSFFIIAFAPIFSKIWESKYNPSATVKFALGLILLGLGFGILAYGGINIPKGAQTASVSMAWLILAYLFHTLGELCLSPVGLSYVSKLAPARLVGLMFGIWFGATAVANYLAGWTGSYIDKITEIYSMSGFFLIYTLIPIGAGIVMLALTPKIKKMMHGIH